METCEWCDSLDLEVDDDYYTCNNCTHQFYGKVIEEPFEELDFEELSAIAKTVPTE
jgi:hypothetical protein